MGYKPLRIQCLVLRLNSTNHVICHVHHTELKETARLPSLLTNYTLLLPVSILTALVFPLLTTMMANITRYLAIRLRPASDDVILAPSVWI